MIRHFERELKPTEQNTLEGYVIIFDSESELIYEDNRLFRESFSPNAFDEWLNSEHDIMALYCHDGKQVLGRESNKTLKIEKDEKGIKVTITPPQTTLGSDVVSLIRDGYIKGMSAGFFVNRQGIKYSGQTAPYKRTIVSGAGLNEVTITPKPAYTETEIRLRELPEQEAIEQFTKQKIKYTPISLW